MYWPLGGTTDDENEAEREPHHVKANSSGHSVGVGNEIHLTDEEQDSLDDNSTHDGYYEPADEIGSSTWNEVYFTRARFSAETTAAAVSALLNAAVLVTLFAGTFRRSCSGSTGNSPRPTQTIYGSLFINLMLANTLSSISSWFCNNIFYLASDSMAGTDHCTCLVYLAAAFFLSTAFGLASIMTILGFAVVQYFAICRPLQNLAVVSSAKVIGYVIMSWLLPLIGSCLPMAVLVAVHQYSGPGCPATGMSRIHVTVEVGVNASVCVVMLVYLTVFALCCRIYFEVRQLQQRLLQFRPDTSGELTQERRAFITTIMLLATLTFFYLPHTIYYFVSFNGGTPDTEHQAIVFYMTLMPYLKMASDPVVYGVRMRRRRPMTNDTIRGGGGAIGLVALGTTAAANTANGVSTTAAIVATDELNANQCTTVTGSRLQSIYVCCCFPICGRLVLSFAANSATERRQAVTVPEATSLTMATSMSVRQRWPQEPDVTGVKETTRHGFRRIWSSMVRRHQRQSTGSIPEGLTESTSGTIRLNKIPNKGISMTSHGEQEKFL